MSTLSFFDPSDIESGFLSNFYRSEVKLDGTIWPTVEHYYQAQKFQDAAQVERIRQASTPRHAKNLGQARDVTLREDWGTHRMTAMLRALTAKFTQHVLLQQKLMMTGDAIFVEASPHDGFWGNGPDGRGENRLGYLLTSLRDQLRMALAQVDGISADPQALAQQCFDAVRTLHVTWWLPDSLRTEAQTGALPDQLHAYVRDVDLPDGYLEQYRPGLIFREPTFCDVSEHSKEGLAAKHRYFLLSGNARHVDSFFGGMSGSPGTGLCMFAPNTLWKVLAVHRAESYAQITLLEIPPVALHAFNCQALTVLEQGLADEVAEQFAQALQRPALDACKGADWLARLKHPLGIENDGAFLECWFNGLHDRTAPRPMEESVAVTTGSAAVRADKPNKDTQWFKRSLGLLVMLIGLYIGWTLLANAPRPFQMVIISVAMVMMGAWMAWRPGDIH